MGRAQALALLGITGEATPALVALAFRRRVMAGHPDTGDGSICDMTLLMQAKKVALSDPETSNSACMLCQGAGMVRARVGSVRCFACNGTGDRYGHARK